MARVLASSKLCFQGSASGFQWPWQFLCDLIIMGSHGSQLTWRGGPRVTVGSPIILAASREWEAAVGSRYARADVSMQGSRTL